MEGRGDIIHNFRGGADGHGEGGIFGKKNLFSFKADGHTKDVIAEDGGLRMVDVTEKLEKIAELAEKDQKEGVRKKGKNKNEMVVFFFIFFLN